MVLSEQPGFDQLTSAQRVEVQDWYARRFLSQRASRGDRAARPLFRLQPETRQRWPRPQPMLARPAYLRESPYPASYLRRVARPGSGNHGNTNWQQLVTPEES